MDVTSTVRFAGNVHVSVHDAASGVLVAEQHVHNLVHLVPRQAFAELLYDGATATPVYVTHMAFGTSAAAVNEAHTTLTTEVHRDTITKRTLASNVVTLQHYMGSAAANGNTLRELGLFTGASGGTMVARALLDDPIVKTSAVTVTVVWDITVTATEG